MTTLSGINASTSTSATTGVTNAAHAHRSRKTGYETQGSDNGGGLMQSISQALGQMGISMTPPAQGSGPQQDTQNSAVPQAMGQLMHDLMHALQQQSASPAANGSQGSYSGDFSSSLQTLIQQLESSSTSSSGTSSSGGTDSNSALSQLTADFNNLLNAVKTQSGSAQSTTGTDAQSLLTFLKNLQANLATHSTPKTGGLIGTSA